jgi:hypothetical protein
MPRRNIHRNSTLPSDLMTEVETTFTCITVELFGLAQLASNAPLSNGISKARVHAAAFVARDIVTAMRDHTSTRAIRTKADALRELDFLDRLLDPDRAVDETPLQALIIPKQVLDRLAEAFAAHDALQTEDESWTELGVRVTVLRESLGA